MYKSDINKALRTAEGFKASALYLQSEIEKNSIKLLEYGPACTANLAFACEIYLKILISCTSGNYLKGHKLKTLYDKIDSTTKNSIENQYIFKCDEYKRHVNTKAKLRDIDTCLMQYNSAYEDWRYWFEPADKNSKCLSWIDFRILIEILTEEVATKVEG